MKIFNKGNYKILLPVIALALLLFAIFVLGDNEGGFIITLGTPANNTAAATTAYTFNCTATTNNSANNISNLTLYFGPKGVGYPIFNQTNSTAVTNNTEYTFTVTNIAEGSYLWTCGAGVYNGSGGFSNQTINGTNRTITFDTTPPVITGISPDSIGTPTNYTALPIKLNVTIREAGNISSVFYILNTVVVAGGANPGLNDSDTVNSSHFMTFAAGSQQGTNYTYTANLTLNFTSSFTNPGAHSLWFCANDTANNVRCTSTSLSFVIKGVNISELRTIYNGSSAGGFTMNISLENGTADEDGFMEPTLQNYTLTLNRTADRLVSIFGMTINESYMRDVTNTQVNNSITSGVRTAIGNDFDINITFMNVSSFLPGGTLYKFGRFDFMNKQFERLYHCTGSVDSPICTQISGCNGTIVLNETYDNSSRIIPENSACFVTNLTNYTGVSSGNTYIYSGTFSGGAGANDTTAPAITFVTPTQNQNVTSLPFNINISFTDESGVNNNTINITVNGTVYSNLHNTSLLTCTPNTNASTTITCNITLNTLRDGLQNITAEVRDSSVRNNSNLTSITYNLSIVPTITLNHPRDQSWFHNMTNAIVFNYTAENNDFSSCSLWGNFTGNAFAINETNKSALANGYPGTMTNFSGLKFAQGSYVWNVRCNDSKYSGQRSANYTFYVDTIAPSVTATASKNSLSTGESVTLSCSATDNMDTSPNVSISSISTPNGYSVDLDGTFTDTTTAGTYRLNCRGTDIAGGTASTYTEFTVYGGSGSSGGSGGSSGGAVSTISTLFTKVLAGEPIEAKISNAETGVDAVTLTANAELSNVKVSVSQFNENPATKEIEGTVFKYLEVKATNAPDDKLSRVLIKFHVDKAWLTDNNAEAGDVLFSRFVNGAWIQLEVTKVSEDANKVYYSSLTPGLSYFAISLKPKAATTSEQPTTEETAETPEVIPPEDVITQEKPKSSKTWLWVVLGLLLVGGVSIGAYLMQRKKQRFGKK